MTTGSRRFEVVNEDAPAPPPPSAPKQPIVNDVSITMLTMALSALGQKAIIALSACFTLLTVASVFVLWFLTPDPTDRQITSLTIYASFVLLINIVHMRRK